MDKNKQSNSKYHFPINTKNISKPFLDKFKINNLNFIGDRFQNMIMQDIVQHDEHLLQKLNRNVTSDLVKWFSDKLKNKENVSLSIQGQTRSGKSIIGLKMADNLCRIYKKPFNTNYLICGNQNEYRLNLMKAQEGDIFQIDENAFAQVGDGAMTERMQLMDVQNIIAKMNIHNIYITPKRFLDNNAEYGLKYYEKDTNNWVSKFLLYKLGEFNPVLLGYVIINVGTLFNDYGCFFNKLLGGCTNPKRLILNDITNKQLIFTDIKDINNSFEVKHSIDYLKYSSCIPAKDKNIIAQQLSFKDEKKSPCPFYRLCKHPLCDYEKKKDKWISEEMSGGMGSRQRERFRVGLEILKRLSYYDMDKHKFIIKGSNKANCEIKIKLLLPELTNTKFNKTEFKELFDIITSLGEIDVFKQTMKHLELDFKEQLLKIENGNQLLELIEENE